VSLDHEQSIEKEQIEVVGVRFKRGGKIYNFNPKGLHIEHGTGVIVETTKGIEFAIAQKANNFILAESIAFPIKNIIRIATDEDVKKEDRNRIKELEALQICISRIKHHKLDMKLIDVELTFDLSKIIFYFTADGRIDFRDLVNNLASIFRMRIELRQIGVRDEAKIKNGIGICGRTLCCSTFLDEFQPVSIKMAKEQSLSLNPTKISGVCGRLMCCLKYEEDTYTELIKNLPNIGDEVITPDGEGVILSINVLQQLLKVSVYEKGENDSFIGFYNVSETTKYKSIGEQND
jgi:cell fate regulator YaaT (PSP1 superfamily)